MRGEMAAVNVEESEQGEDTTQTEAASSERRPSTAMLQNMQKKDFQNHYDDGEWSAVARDVTDSHHYGQAGVTEGLATTNPFYAYYLESNSKSHETENIRKETSEEAHRDVLFAPPPEFQTSLLDLGSKMKAVENGSVFSQSQTSKHTEDIFQACALDQSVDVTLKSPDLFSTSPTQTENLSKPWQVKSSNLLKDEMGDLFHTAKEKDLFHSVRASEVKLSDKSPTTFVDPFKSPSNKEGGLFQAPQTVATNPFYTTAATEGDLFQSDPAKVEELFHIKETKQDTSTKKDLFGMSFKENFYTSASSSTNITDSLTSPLSRNLFHDVSSLDDPFSPTPSKQVNQDISNGTPDIFQPSTKTAFSTPLISSPSELRLDTPASTELLKKTLSRAPPAVPPKPLHRPQEIVLTTPQGSKHDILQPTPFSQAVSLSTSPSQSPSDMTHVHTFRRPPRPLPRTRPPRREKPPKQEESPEPVISIEPEPEVQKRSPKLAFRPLPKPVIYRKPETQDIKPVDSENFVVFEDILLIGQEKCVEDWPEDSPEVKPEFKPSGKLKLRRESLKAKMDSDGGSGEDQGGTGSPSKRKDKKFKISLVSRRGSKDKFTDDTMERRSSTLPSRKSSKEYFLDSQGSAGENEDEEQNGMSYKKKPLKTKVNQLFRRASTASSLFEGKHMNEHLPQESKDRDNKKSGDRNTIVRRWSEGKALDESTGEEEEGGEPHHEKRKKKMTVKFVPHRGFAIALEKTNAEPKGAHGYTPHKGSKEKSPDFGSHAYTPHEKSQDFASEDIKEMKDQRRQSSSKVASMDAEQQQKPHHYSPYLDEDAHGIQDCKPKKPTKIKLPHLGRRRSKENMRDDNSIHKKKSSLSAEELDDEELSKMEDSKTTPITAQRRHKAANGVSASSGFSHHLPQHASREEFAQDEITEKDLTGPEEWYSEEPDEHDVYKPKKPLKLKVFKKLKPKSKAMYPGNGPPGATSSDYMSEAAKAEWMAAQMDERAIAGMEDEDEEGDTDSLMEWWYTVEQWDEVPSDEEDAVMKEDESKSFTILAEKVQRGLRVFNKVFTERAEVLWQSIIMLHTIADDISEFHQKAKIAGITGGTTTAVGGVTAIAGLALAPFTFGASLVITAVGVGVATAGGITSASAAISDNVNNTQDRKKVEIVLKEYEDHLLDIGKILHFINQGLYKLRGHPFLRSGTQHYSEDWEIRRAVQMISLVDSPVMRATEMADTAVASLQGLFKGMDKYFIKETRELKKGCKKEIVGQIREVANVLNDTIVELNAIREELQEATGTV